MFFDRVLLSLPGATVNAGNLSALALIVLAGLWIRYTAKVTSFNASKQRQDGNGEPSTFPYFFPFVGTLPLAYVFKPRDFVSNPKNFFQSPNPVRVKIFHRQFFVVQGQANVQALFKKSWQSTSIPFVKFAVGSAFGLPAKAFALYDRDDSGGGNAPHPDSKVEPHNRVDWLTHQSLVRFLEGPGLVPFVNRFVESVTKQVHRLYENVGTEWEHRDDLMQLVGDEAMVAVLDALCGPYFLKLNPDFVPMLWEFDRNLQTYLQGMPRFLAPRAYAARDKCLNAVRIWEKHARDNFKESDIGPDGCDPYWGNSTFRERHEMFLKMDGYDHEAVACQDLGQIWAARNAIVSTEWCIFEVFRDPELLATVRAEIDPLATKDAEGRLCFDVDQLLRLPVLQAVYAETLRLRMHFYLMRMPDRVDMDIRGWLIPKRNACITLTTVAHMDTQAWKTGLNNEHPVEEFWVGRFLTYPDQKSSQPVFSTKEFDGSWIPYGGGPRQCPGRHFAKRQILLTTALVVSQFDCEILGKGKDVKEDFTLKGFGGGISHPAGKVPIRIRRTGRGG